MVMTVQTTVTNHLYLMDQFCGFEGTVRKAHVIFPDRADIAVTVDSKNQNHKSFPENGAIGLRAGEKSLMQKAKNKSL